MAKNSNNHRHASDDADKGQIVRQRIEEDTADHRTNPNVREDPGLLPMTKDPRERRLERNTM